MDWVYIKPYGVTEKSLVTLPAQALGPYEWTPNPAGDLDRAN